MTKQDILTQLGYNKFDLLRDGFNGEDTTQLLHENMYHKCEVCKSWEETFMTGGNSEGTICQHCYENSTHPIVVNAKEIYAEIDGM